MRTGISITVTPSDRLWLEALTRDRNAPQKHVWRTEIGNSERKSASRPPRQEPTEAISIHRCGKKAMAIAAEGEHAVSGQRWREAFFAKGRRA